MTHAERQARDHIRRATKDLRSQRDQLQGQLDRVQSALRLLEGAPSSRAATGRGSKPKRLSNAGREAISRAAKARWRRYRAAKRRARA